MCTPSQARPALVALRGQTRSCSRTSATVEAPEFGIEANTPLVSDWAAREASVD